jgi:hypothetical protein
MSSSILSEYQAKAKTAAIAAATTRSGHDETKNCSNEFQNEYWKYRSRTCPKANRRPWTHKIHFRNTKFSWSKCKPSAIVPDGWDTYKYYAATTHYTSIL